MAQVHLTIEQDELLEILTGNRDEAFNPSANAKRAAATSYLNYYEPYCETSASAGCF